MTVYIYNGINLYKTYFNFFYYNQKKLNYFILFKFNLLIYLHTLLKFIITTITTITILIKMSSNASKTNFDLNYLAENQPSMCIPRVFENISERQVRDVF